MIFLQKKQSKMIYFNNVFYPGKKYRCLTCGSDKIGFFVDRLDFPSLVLINSGNAKMTSITDVTKYKELCLWKCGDCFEVGEFTG